MSFYFSVKICDTNPHRWYVSYKFQELISLSEVKSVLQKNSYTILADTPTVVVFQDSKLKLTWNKHGLIQVDFNENKIYRKDVVEDLVRKILNKFL